MTAQDKAFEIIKRIRRVHKLSERDAITIALITVDEINSELWDLEPAVDEKLRLYREVKAKTEYFKEVESVLKKLSF